MRGRQMLRRGRDLSRARFSETVEFYKTVKGIDPDTLQPVTIEERLFLDRFPDGVPARVKMTGTQPRDEEIAGQAPTVDAPEVHVPVGSALAGPSVMIRVLGSTADEALIGAKFRTRFWPSRGQVTAWRYPVEQVS